MVGKMYNLEFLQTATQCTLNHEVFLTMLSDELGIIAGI